MAKKKNSQKKHTFKHAPSRETAAPAVSASTIGTATVATAPAEKSPLQTAPAGTTVRDFSYVAGDMKRIGLAAVVLVVLELVLYYVLTHTSAGEAVYNLVKV